MTALSIQPTFPIFTDIDGQPLEAGYIFIGVANLAPIGNPINVYWDAALTLPAVQPIRTIGGYPVNSGTPARLYVNSDYSIQVQNRNGSVVYSAPAATERYGNIISSADIPFIQAGAGAVTRTAQAKMRDMVSVTDFGADPTGVSDSTVAFENAHATGKLVYAPDGDYLVERIDVSGVSYVGLWGPGARLVLKPNDGLGGLGYIYKVTDPGDFYLCVEEVFANTTAVKAGNNDNSLINVYTTGAARATNSVIVENTKFTGSAQRWGQILVTNNEIYGNGARVIRVDATVHSGYGNYPAIKVRGGHRAVYVSGCSFDNNNGITINYGSLNSAVNCTCEVGSIDSIGDIKITGCNYQYGVGFFFGQKFNNCVLDGINILGEGKNSAGVTYGFNSTVIKIDDIGANATFAANNINIQSPSTESAGYSFACEESTPSTTGTVTLSNWLTGGQIRCIALAKQYTLQKIRFIPRSGGSGSGYTGSMLANLPSVPCFVSECTFESLNPAFNDQNGFGVYTNNFFIDSAVTVFGTSDGSIYANNKFGGGGLSDAIVFDSLNSASPVRCTLINNQKVGSVTKRVRIAGTAASGTNFKLTAVNNTLDWDYASLDSNSGDPNWYAVGNTLMTDKIRPTAVGTSATPSIQGLTTITTNGAGNNITNFANGRNWHRITVYLETGDTIVNGASIVTKSGANIAGRAVREFSYFGGVWYEV